MTDAAIRAILTLNSGSSSIKFALFAADRLQVLLRGSIAPLGATALLKCEGELAERAGLPGGLGDPPQLGSHADILRWLLAGLRRVLPDLDLLAAGHRVVHGGAEFDQPLRIEDATIGRLERLSTLAPQHQPHNLDGIRAVAEAWPALPQIACFDTAFHRTQPRLAQLFALPRALAEEGILRYGFHGLSYQHIAGRLPAIAGSRAQGRVVIAHLGAGASMCALRDLRSVATTMGFTALDGLMMGRRCGAIDPGVLLYLMRERAMDADALERLLGGESGLLGVSGISDDVRELESSDDPRAAEALELFAYRAARELGSLAATIDGLDVLVFTGGIGENSATMRERICARAGWLGVALDPAANARHALHIGSAAATVDVLVVPTDEERVIAASVQSLLADGG